MDTNADTTPGTAKLWRLDTTLYIVGISGKMCSGKTTLLNELEAMCHEAGVHFAYQKLAQGVYDIAREYFGMIEKNRPLLQAVGCKMREIDKDVWVKKFKADAMKLLHSLPNNSSVVFVCDDVRFPNELHSFVEMGAVTIRLKVDEEAQLARLIKTYPTTWKTHHNNRHDVSETALDKEPDDSFDFVFDSRECVSARGIADRVFCSLFPQKCSKETPPPGQDSQKEQFDFKEWEKSYNERMGRLKAERKCLEESPSHNS